MRIPRTSKDPTLEPMLRYIENTTGAEEWQSYTPVLTASPTPPTLGSSGNQAQATTSSNGKVLLWMVRFTFGSVGAAAGSGQYKIAMPSGYTINNSLITEPIVGNGYLRDQSASTRYIVNVVWESATSLFRFYLNNGTEVFNNNPFTWAANDELGFYAMVPIR